MVSGPGRIWTRQFAVLWCIGFLTYASVYLLVPILPLYLKDVGLSTAAIGALLGLMSAAALFTRPFAGWLSDGFGRRPLIVAGLAGLLIFPLALPFISGVALFAALRLASGVGWGSITANANTLAGELAPPARRGEAIGLYTMAGSTAFALSPAVGLALVRMRGYEAAFLAAAGLTALGLLLATRLPRTPRAMLVPISVHGLISRPALGPAGVVVLHAMIYGGIITFLPLLAQARRLGDPALFFTIYALGLIVMRGVAGRLSDRFGRAAIIGPGMLLGAAAMAVLAMATARWQMLIAAPIVTLSMAFVQPPSLAWALDLGGERRATAMATVVAAQDLGISLGGVVLGAAGSAGGYAGLFGAGAVLAVLGFLGLGVVARVQRHEALEPGRLLQTAIKDDHLA